MSHAAPDPNPATPGHVGVGSSALLGEFVRAGTMVVSGEELTGYVVATTVDELRSAPRLPMYRRVAIIDAELLARFHRGLTQAKALLCDKYEFEAAAELIELIKASSPNTKDALSRKSTAIGGQANV